MLELVAASAVLAAVGWWASARTRRRNEGSRALDRYAQSRGLVFVPAPHAAASPRVRGRIDDTDYVVDLYRLGGEVRTRISARAARGAGAKLSVVQRRSYAASAIANVEPMFDAAYVVIDGVGDVAALLRPAVASLLQLDRCAGVWLRSEDGRVALSWRGIESDPLVVDVAAGIVAGIAATHAPDAPYR